MIQAIRALIRYRELLFMITWRDFRIKYKQTVMGFLWAIFMPLVIVAAGIMVKLAFSHLSGKPLQLADIITVAVKSLPWAFFVASLRFSSNSLISNSNLVTKIYFPRIIFPVAAVISQFIDFAISSSLLFILLVIASIGASVYLLWVPVLLVILVLIATGLGILSSAANLYFRDVKYIVEIILTFAIFFTPVFYEAEMFGKWKTLLMINPVAPVLEGLRSCVVLRQCPDLFWVSYSALFALILVAVSIASFARLEPLFAERI